MIFVNSLLSGNPTRRVARIAGQPRPAMCPKVATQCRAIGAAATAARPARHRNPMDTQGTAATTTSPASIASRYTMIGRIPRFGSIRPIAPAA